ncbi:MAG: Smr/MutS family protein [Sphaerochaetaceae bacterium]|jgi:DNA-nicking Smr family endonuclease
MGFGKILEQWESSEEGKKAAKKSRLSSVKEKAKPPSYPTGKAQLGALKRMKAQAELDLHGFTASEAQTEVADFLASAAAKRLLKVRIVHGRGLHSKDGKGVLRDVVESVLKESPHVRTWATPPPREGGDGAVWVVLKRG